MLKRVHLPSKGLSVFCQFLLAALPQPERFSRLHRPRERHGSRARQRVPHLAVHSCQSARLSARSGCALLEPGLQRPPGRGSPSHNSERMPRRIASQKRTTHHVFMAGVWWSDQPSTTGLFSEAMWPDLPQKWGDLMWLALRMHVLGCLSLKQFGQGGLLTGPSRAATAALDRPSL